MHEAVTLRLLSAMVKRVLSLQWSVGMVLAIAWILTPHVMATEIETSTNLIEEVNARTGVGPSVATFVKIAFEDIYFFRGNSKQSTEATDPAEIAQTLRVDEDRWSSAIRMEQGVAGRAEKRMDFGIKVLREENQRVTVGYVFDNSPAAQAGIKRGDRIVRLDGVDVRKMTNEELLRDLSEEKQQLMVQTYRQNAGVFKYQLQNISYEVVAIPEQKIVNYRGVKVAYVHLTGFLPDWKQQLPPILRELAKEEFEYLILDLRYNVGGLSNALLYVASAIGGENVSGRIAEKEIANNRYANRTQERQFSVDSDVALNLKRIAVITTYSTCSASEGLVMLLKPYIEVGVIGTPSCGKPYLQRPIYYDGWKLRVLKKIVQNVLGESVPLTGLSTNCGANDDTRFALGDVREESLKVALHWLVKDRECLSIN
jgi:hypothetical protein